jgi:exodeoxyribonuclease-3
MKITTWNVNGLRAALRKGFADHLQRLDPDVLLLQEVRAFPEQLPELWMNPTGYHVHWHPAQKPGYAGTAVWSKQPIEHITHGLSKTDHDDEGRVITAQTAGLTVASIYLPKGETDTPKQDRKDAWMRRFRRWAGRLSDPQQPVILGGDLNIAHTPRDLYYARSNENTSGYLPHERAWFTRLLKSGWHDVVREQFGDIDGPYSWWSNRGQARALDRGWRIDYLLTNAPAAKRLKSVSIDREAGLACSDHAPVTAELA